MATLEERVTALEQQIRAQEQAQSSMDDDLHTISERTRAISHLVQALSITQSEHTEEFRRIRTELAGLKAGQTTIVGLLEELIRRDDERRTDSNGVGD